MKLSPRNKLILVAVAFIAVVIVIVVALIVPVVTRMGQLDTAVDKAEQERSAARTLLDQRQAIRDRAVENDAQLLQLANALPETPELPSLIVELQDRAYDNDIVLRSIEPLPPVQNDGRPYVEMSLNLVIWGAWDDSVDYMQELQKTARLIRVNEFRSEAIDEQTRIDAEPELDDYDTATSMRITAYVLPASDGTATAPAAPQQ